MMSDLNWINKIASSKKKVSCIKLLISKKHNLHWAEHSNKKLTTETFFLKIHHSIRFTQKGDCAKAKYISLTNKIS